MMESKTKKLLFVDDEPKVLQGLERMLHPMGKEWEMRFVESGAEALALLQQESFDVIITDMGMPGMDGLQLLTEVKHRAPDMIRVVLSGYSEHQLALQAIPLAHQFLAKPCDPRVFISTIKRAMSLGNLLNNRALKRVITEISVLPSLPNVYLQLEQAIKTHDNSLDNIAKIISQDMGMTAKVLQLANSAYFCLPQTITSPKEAVFYLGINTLEAMVLAVHIFSVFKNTSLFSSLLNELWLHSQATAAISEGIARSERVDKETRGYASMAGLLHDCGKLTLADNFPDDYQQAINRAEGEHLPLWQAEEKIFGVHHGAVGAYLLGLWGIPGPIIEAVAFHHHPHSLPQEHFNVLTAVHVANGLQREDTIPAEKTRPVDEQYLSLLEMAHRLPDWQGICREIMDLKTKHTS